MIQTSEHQRIAVALPSLNLIDSDLGGDLFSKASLIRIREGQDVMAVGDRAIAIPLLVSGQIRVHMIGESGREITLYRFQRGECCVLTADAIIGHRPFPANATAEEETEMVLVPADVFDDWSSRHATWRNFVLEAMSKRLASLMFTLDEVAFRRMDRRVAALLLARSEVDRQVPITHQEIANELGSSREVISRILEDFRGRGLVQLTRGAIAVIDRQKLQTSTEL